MNRLPRGFLAIGRTDLLGLPSNVFISLGVLAVAYVAVHRSTFGRRLRAFGHNARAAELGVIPTAFINVIVYVVGGVLAAGRPPPHHPGERGAAQMGGGIFHFEVVTAAIVGGTSLFGGVGLMLGSLFGVLTVKSVENCINLLGVSYHLYLAVRRGDPVAIVFENVKNRSLSEARMRPPSSRCAPSPRSSTGATAGGPQPGREEMLDGVNFNLRAGEVMSSSGRTAPARARS